MLCSICGEVKQLPLWKDKAEINFFMGGHSKRRMLEISVWRILFFLWWLFEPYQLIIWQFSNTIVFLFALAKETTSAQPERFTPLLFRTQHPIVKFSGGKLISILGGNDTEIPKCTIAAVQVGRMSQLSQKKKHCKDYVIKTSNKW